MSTRKLKIVSIVCIAAGTFLNFFSAFIPPIQRSQMATKTKTNSYLTSDNQSKWDTVPGKYGYDV